MLPVLHQPTIERPHLLDMMRLSLQHKLTLISAPPGYGKTTLAAQFAYDTTVPVVWQTVEAQERDLPNLVTHCVEALSSVVTYVDELKINASAPAAETATLISEHLRNSLSGDMVYVLDDVHHLLDSPQSERWLQTFIGRIPSTCHVILIGRALPSFPMQEMFARREVLAFGQKQLRFSFQEIQDLSQQLGASVTTQEIENIVIRFDGWAAGSILALQPLPAEISTSVFSGESASDALFDTLAEIMLHAQNEALQDFLLASSTLTRMTPTSCQIVLGLTDSREYLAAVVNHNLFVSEIPKGLTYHPLFRDFLQRYLKHRDPARFIAFHCRAAQWFEDNNLLDEAVVHYVSAARWHEAGAIAERAASTYLAQGKAETVLSWRNQLIDADMVFPQLLYLCAVIELGRYLYDKADADLVAAEQGFQARFDELGILKVSLEKANLDIVRGRYQAAQARIEDRLKDDVMPSNLRGYSLSILGSACLNLGDVESALSHLEAALPLYRATGDTYALSHLLLTLESANMRIGRFDEASTYLQEAIAIRRALGSNAGLVAPLNNLAFDQHLLGEYDEASLTYQEALQLAIRTANARSESYGLGGLGDLERDRGAFDEAATLYRKALRIIGSNNPALRCATLSSFSTLRRWQGNLQEGLNLANEAEILAEEHSLAFEQLQSQVCVWAIRAQEGEPTDAQRELARLATTIAKRHEQTLWAQALAISASAALLRGDIASASQSLKSVVDGVAHQANLQRCVAEIVHTPLLMTFVKERGGRFPSLLEGIKRLEAAQIGWAENTHPKELPAVPTYSLRVWMLGQEKVERDGDAVPNSVWRAAEARELFFYLLLKGATTKEQIGLVFWEDSTPEQVRQKFHATLHRARTAVGTNAIQFEGDLYFINPDVEVWSDAVEFESLAQQARLASPLNAHTENLWQRAVTVYEGELLLAYDATWVALHREALHQMYLEALFGLGNCIRLRGSFQEAIAMFQRALAVDPYREDVYRAIFTCYSALGERSSIERQLGTLEQLLDTDLGIKPSVETRALAQSLLT